MTSSGDFAYTGCENLEAMTEAVNYNRFLVDLVLAQVPGGDARVLDFGAGRGTYAKMLAERGTVPDCLEPDATLQGELRGAGLKVISSTDEIPDSSYDVIYTLNVLEHIENDRAEVDRLAALLKPGGRIVIYVPAFQLLYSAMDDLVGHYRRYRLRGLAELVAGAGLEVEKAQYYDPIGFWAALVYRVIRGSGKINPNSVRVFDKYAFPVSKALHPVTGKAFGKNLVVVGRKPL